MVDGVKYQYGVPCECGMLMEGANARRAQFAAVPETFRDVTWDDFKTEIYSSGFHVSVAQDALRDARRWVDSMPFNMSEGTGLYLYSRAKGSGKTMMACIIANELMKQRYSVLFATTLDILDKIKESWNGSEEREIDILRKLTTTQVLVLDDIGVEGTKDWIRERFFKIVNERYNKRKPTIYTSNVEMQYLRIDSRVTSRIEETSYLIEFPDESVRAGAGKRLNATYAKRAKEYMEQMNRPL